MKKKFKCDWFGHVIRNVSQKTRRHIKMDDEKPKPHLYSQYSETFPIVNFKTERNLFKVSFFLCLRNALMINQ